MKAKLIILVITALALGFILGMLTSAQLRLKKLEPVRTYFSADRFREGFYRIVEPDEAQKTKIDQIFHKYSRANNELHSSIRKEIDANFKAMRKELDSVLTKEQIEKLREMDARRQEMIKQYKKERKDDSVRFKHGSRHLPGNKDPRPDL